MKFLCLYLLTCLYLSVNTLANWTTEFQKWIGESSGKDLPFIRFYAWDEKVDRVKLIKEWHEHGGIMCVSSSRYASTVSKIEKDSMTKENNEGAKEKKGSISVENGFVLHKALVEPGPDIVVLDEAHTMLKNSTSSIFKRLSNIATKLRLSLTGTPLQNNLMEYYRMANWTSPGILGTEVSMLCTAISGRRHFFFSLSPLLYLSGIIYLQIREANHGRNGG